MSEKELTYVEKMRAMDMQAFQEAEKKKKEEAEEQAWKEVGYIMLEDEDEPPEKDEPPEDELEDLDEDADDHDEAEEDEANGQN